MMGLIRLEVINNHKACNRLLFTVLETKINHLHCKTYHLANSYLQVDICCYNCIMEMRK